MPKITTRPARYAVPREQPEAEPPPLPRPGSFVVLKRSSRRGAQRWYRVVSASEESIRLRPVQAEGRFPTGPAFHVDPVGFDSHYKSSEP